MKVRHPDHSFNFAGKGEWYEPESDEELDALVKRYPDVEVMLASMEATLEGVEPLVTCAPMPMIDVTTLAVSPIYASGWWTWRGKKYRKSNLPPEALALIEE